MSQAAFLSDFDADLHMALAESGLADVGTYTAPTTGAVAVPVRAYVDKGVRTFGEYAQTYAGDVTVTMLRADVPDPAEGGIVAIDGGTYTLRTPIDSDDGITVWGAV